MGKKALEAARLNAFAMDPDDLFVAIEKAHPLFDPRALLPLEEALVLNIMAHGILQPVLVRKNGDVAEVVAGRRRVLHAREANKRLRAQGAEPILVPVMVKKGDDAKALGIIISENEQRKDDSVLSKARKAARLADLGQPDDHIAVHFGVEKNTIRLWLKLLDCAGPVQTAVEDGRLAASHAIRELADLPRDRQVEALGEILERGAPAAEAAVRAGGKRKTKRAGVGKGELRRLLKAETDRDPFSKRERTLLGWIAGTASVGDVLKEIPALTGIIDGLKGAGKARAKKAA